MDGIYSKHRLARLKKTCYVFEHLTVDGEMSIVAFAQLVGRRKMIIEKTAPARVARS